MNLHSKHAFGSRWTGWLALYAFLMLAAGCPGPGEVAPPIATASPPAPELAVSMSRTPPPAATTPPFSPAPVPSSTPSQPAPSAAPAASATAVPPSPRTPTPSPAPSVGPRTSPTPEEVFCSTENVLALQAYNDAGDFTEEGKLAEAEQSYLKAISLDPRYCDAMDNLGVLLRQQGRVNEAIDWYKKSIEVLPDNTLAHMNLGVAYRLTGKIAEAISEYETLVKLKPDDAEGYYGLGQCYLESGRAKEAIPKLEQAEKIYASESSPWIADAHHALGLAYEDLEQCDKARGYYELAYPAMQDDADLNYRLGGISLFCGEANLKQALRYMDKAIQLKPDNADYHLRRGLANFYLEDYQAALADFDRVVELQPGNAEAHDNLGVMYRLTGDLERAIASHTRAIEIEPGLANAYQNRGNAYLSQEDYERALADYNRVLQLKPDRAQAYCMRGMVYEAKGQTALAIADVKKCEELAGDETLRNNARQQRTLLLGTPAPRDISPIPRDKAVEMIRNAIHEETGIDLSSIEVKTAGDGSLMVKYNSKFNTSDAFFGEIGAAIAAAVPGFVRAEPPWDTMSLIATEQPRDSSAEAKNILFVVQRGPALDNYLGKLSGEDFVKTWK